ncbi:hypothetical protein Sjap_026484 [Stephania japonica]|uniref:Uncharacterized protein n=1 Tax=Stephania japonica TaxID=461633 RepID=A0AAP0E6T8_9MAGN
MMSDKIGGGETLMKPTKADEVVEKLMLGLIPDEEVKMLIKDQLQRRTDWIYSHSFEQRFAQLHNIVEFLRGKSAVTETKDYNGDEHDIPIGFAKLTLGRALKFSWSYFEDKSSTLDDAEKAMLDLYCERAQIKDGHRILDLGCGYGALAIHIASKYPYCHVIGITDTTSQKKFIEEQCKNQNLENVEVILGDITKFELNKEFDRVMVLDVLENDVSIVNHWVLNGKHISRTSEEWLKKLDDNADEAKAIAKDILGSEYEAVKWINQWRTSYLHAIELGEFNNGEEWVLAQYLFKKKY